MLLELKVWYETLVFEKKTNIHFREYTKLPIGSQRLASQIYGKLLMCNFKKTERPNDSTRFLLIPWFNEFSFPWILSKLSCFIMLVSYDSRRQDIFEVKSQINQLYEIFYNCIFYSKVLNVYFWPWNWEFLDSKCPLWNLFQENRSSDPSSSYIKDFSEYIQDLTKQWMKPVVLS